MTRSPIELSGDSEKRLINSQADRDGQLFVIFLKGIFILPQIIYDVKQFRPQKIF